MNWIKYSINTTTEAEEIVSATLAELGIDSIEIENNVPVSGDKQGGEFEELQPDLPSDDGSSKVSFYLSEEDDHESLLSQVKAELEDLKSFMDIGRGTIDTSVTKQEDWINNWKQFFKSFYIDDILIKPTWEEIAPSDQGKIFVEIDPGVSFGTGKHETTQLCIRQLKKYLKAGDEILDIGCGSGILSIIANKLLDGKCHLVGTDIDDDCIASTYENFKVNHIDESAGDFYVGNLIDDKDLQDKVGYEKYDVVVANILADIIIAMAPAIPPTMKSGAYFISSGIIDFKENEVKDALEAVGLEVVEINHQGEWVNITARKN
ncbi:50S ribosomal protein L11 methyltransferase [Pseudobutyrivibrio xylanivorans]|uniref:Ribosomal protein L11 methyltransferase n=1 Tax=Pseudobutyrivibrio xylanivorans TaxID=185007 RepID=A0A5P6VTQ8_PSEXY|nr:50S ribosomal protein L11 methyltransferase [Pseudobutyrivibrio xylanivorans]QFJ55742.1 50S ribosomal protein L11 methyltransferase [Pseudobutyrivibrio xylanivorans]